MDMLLIIFWAFLMCFCVSVLITTFPATYPRERIKKKTRKLQVTSLLVDIIVCIVTIAMHEFFRLSLGTIQIKIAVILIPVTTSVLFCASLYYPIARYLVSQNIKDQETMDSILDCLFKCAYSDTDETHTALKKLTQLQKQEEEFLNQYGLFPYLCEYTRQSEFTISKKPSESTIRCVLDRCNQVKHDIDSFTPVPFPCIGMILSFLFSTVFTVLLSITTIIE